MYDPWDEDFFYAELHARTRLIPHRKLTHAQRWRLAQEFTRPGLAAHGTAATAALPEAFGPLWCDADNVAVSAFYREEPAGGPGAYPELGPRPPIAYPYIVRLVELNGQPTPVRLYLPGQIAAAYKTNLLGEIQAELPVSPSKRSFPGLDTWSEIAVDMRPFEIATLYVDIVLGRKIARDLDSHRSVWATVHRVDQPSHP
ncbi:MAG: glycosyl hydrolase-related protein, partial [Candidatus Roseilinea sp.]|uniref:glycosyl hydrolase-related protein n=1 Tax=Candidatus Roseilinea sp. TaxID=2838777 RepID=UPI00404BA2EB